MWNSGTGPAESIKKKKRERERKGKNVGCVMKTAGLLYMGPYMREEQRNA